MDYLPTLYEPPGRERLKQEVLKNEKQAMS